MSLSEPILDYVLDAKPLYQSLRQAFVQLSAFLLLRLTDRQRMIVDHGPVELARSAYGECAKALADLGMPAGTAHHRRHLDGAAEAVASALRAAESGGDIEGDDLYRALKQAERHLRALGRILPGFEPVDFTQACCATHASLTRIPPERRGNQ